MAGTNELQQPKYVDFGEYILFQVKRTQTLIRQTDLLLLVAAVCCAVLFVLLGFVLLDHWLFAQGLNSVWRWLGFTGIVGSVVSGVIYFLRTSAGKDVSDLYAARTLERAESRLSNNLLTLVDLGKHRRNTSPLILGSLEKRAALTLNDLDVDQAVDRKLLLRLLYALLVGTILLIGYAFASQKSTLDSIYRVLFPWTSAAVPTQTRIHDVQPGNQTVTAGTHVTVSAFIDGKIPADSWLVYSTADKRIINERIRLQETENSLGKFAATITGENGRGVDQTTRYFIEAGDGRSSEYVLAVKPAPRVTLAEVKLTSPAYTGIPFRSQQNGSLDAVEGTRVDLQAQSNLPITKAWIQLFNSEDLSDRTGQLPLTISDQKQISGHWTLKIRDDGTYPRFYRIECETQDGSRDPQPPLHAMLVRPDERPVVRLLDPQGDLERPLNSTVPLLIEAFDPDFRLSGLSIQVERQGQLISSELIDARNRKALRLTHPLELSRLAVQPGHEVNVWVEARDNREPQPNRRSTSKIKIRIIEPAASEVVEQLRQEDEQRQQEQNKPPQPPATEPDEDLPLLPDEPPAEPMNQPPSDDSSEGSPQPSEGDEGEKGRTQKVGEGSDSSSSEGGQNSGASEEKGDQPQPGMSGDQPSEDNQQPDGEQSDPSQNGSGGDASEPKFSPDGQDDDRVLERLIDRMQQQQNKEGAGETPGSEPPPPGEKPGQQPQDAVSDTPGEQPGSQPEMTAPDQPQPEGTSTPDGQQPGTTPEKSPPSETDRPDPAGPKPGEQPAPQEPGTDPSNPDQPENGTGSKPNEGTEPASEAMKPGEQPNADSTGTDPAASQPDQSPGNGQEKTGETGSSPQPMTEQPPQPGDSQPGPGNQPAQQPGEGDKSPSDTPRPEGDKQPAQQPGQGDSKPGEGNEQGPTSREPDPQKMAPDAQKPLDRPDGSPEQNPRAPKPGEKPQDSVSGEGNQKPSSDKGPGEKPADSAQDSASPASKQPSGSEPPAEGMKPTEAPGQDNQTPPTALDDLPSGQQPDTNQPGQPQDAKGQDPPSGKQPAPPGQGQGESQQPGEGKQPGESSGDGSSPSGKPSDQPGEGQPGQGQMPGEGSEAPGKTGAGGNAAEQGPNAKPGHARGGQGTEDQATQPHSEGEHGPAGTSQTHDRFSLEDRKKAAELVLNKLEDDLKRGEVDENLLQELGWGKDNLKQFQQRMADYLRRQDQGEGTDLKQKQFEEMLKNIRLGSDRGSRTGSQSGRSNKDEFAPTLTPAPPEYRELEQAFRRSLLQQQP
jgi:collagen type III alpha